MDIELILVFAIYSSWFGVDPSKLSNQVFVCFPTENRLFESFSTQPLQLNSLPMQRQQHTNSSNHYGIVAYCVSYGELRSNKVAQLANSQRQGGGGGGWEGWMVVSLNSAHPTMDW